VTPIQSAVLGFRSSADYFASTFLFGLMFGMTASAIGLQQWQALLMSLTSFTASGQFAALEFWQYPLPFGTIALSVALVSSRNLLLGMAMTYQYDGHSLSRRILSLFLLNDPGVVTSYSLANNVDRLGYVTGYGVSMMLSWLLSGLFGLNLATLFTGFDPGSVSFAGPLVMATMMVLFIKGSKVKTTPWVVSGVCSLITYELGAASYLILILSVISGVVVTLFQERSGRE
jgi:predicted branched-subunit amino acid permease